MKKSEELRSAAAELAAEIDELSQLAEPTEEQTARFEEALTEVEVLATSIDECVRAETQERMEKIRAFAAKPSHVQSGDGARVAPVPGASTRNIWDVDEARRSSNSEAAFVAELNSRAATAIEQASAPASIPNLTPDEFREQATRRLEEPIHGDRVGDSVARHWIDFGNPEYRDAWHRALRGDSAAAAFCQAKTFDHEMSRAWAVDGTTTTGGYAIVPDYDVSLLLINAGSVNPMRRIADVKQTVVNKVYGLSTAGVNVGWISESTEEGDDTPAVAQPVWDVQKASGYIEASFETIQDTDLGNEVAFLFNDAKDRLEATAHFTGTGGGEPYGVVTRCASLGALVFGDSGSTTEKEIVVSDIYALDNALDARWRDNASFTANKVILNQVRALSPQGAGSSFWTQLGGGLPSQLIGYPVYQASAMDSTVVSGSLDYTMLLGDFRSGYRIYDRLGSQMLYNPFVVGSSRRPTGNGGWLFYWRTAGDVTDQTSASHFKLLRK
jgi:HK97 family phage major capsid protein